MLEPTEDGNFQQELFVSRLETKVLIRWLETNQEKRLRALVGPPCAGKTWLIQDLLQYCRKKSVRTKYFVLELPLEKIVDHDGRIVENALWNWFMKFLTSEGKELDLQDPAGFVDLPGLIQHLVKKICDGPKIPLLVVDEYDKLNSEAASIFCDLVFEPFLSRPCTRILIGCREFSELFGVLVTRNKWQLPLESAVNENEQFQKLQMQHPDYDPTIIQKWKKLLRHYHWDHPAINTFLFEQETTQRPAFGELTVSDLDQCVQKMLTHAGYTPINEQALRLLKELARCQQDHFTEGWTMIQALEIVSRRMEQIILRGDDRIGQLVRYRLVEHFKDGEFVVTRGLYDILCDINELEAASEDQGREDHE